LLRLFTWRFALYFHHVINKARKEGSERCEAPSREESQDAARAREKATRIESSPRSSRSNSLGESYSASISGVRPEGTRSSDKDQRGGVRSVEGTEIIPLEGGKKGRKDLLRLTFDGFPRARARRHGIAFCAMNAEGGRAMTMMTIRGARARAIYADRIALRRHTRTKVEAWGLRFVADLTRATPAGERGCDLTSIKFARVLSLSLSLVFDTARNRRDPDDAAAPRMRIKADAHRETGSGHATSPATHPRRTKRADEADGRSGLLQQ